MIKLPTEKIKSERINPKTIVIFGNYKTGKSTLLSQLNNCLIIDLEGGTDFMESLKIDVISEARQNKITPFQALMDIMKSIKQANTEKGGYVYKYIALDTLTALEDIAVEYAGMLYRNTPMGKNWQGDNVLDLPQGTGYYYLRNAIIDILNKFETLCDTLIMTGHLKDKLVESNGQEMNIRGLSLSGKTPAIIGAHVDAIAYLYRKDNQNILNFKPSEAITIGTRVKHLNEQEIVIGESNEAGELTTYWEKVFKNN